MTASRICPIEGCEVVLQPRKLMCPKHWRTVPKPLRAEVKESYRALARGGDLQVLARYRQAVRAAITAVHAAINHG